MVKNVREVNVFKVFMLVFLVACFSLSNLSANAQQDGEFYKQAIGGRFGAANGVTYKHFINDQGHAIDGILNFQGNRKYGVFKLVGLYQLHQNIAALDYQGLRWYYGAGAGLGYYNDKEFDDSQVALSVDGVVGIDFKIPNSPINLALDWKPMLELSPNAGMKFDGFGLSVRFVLF